MKDENAYLKIPSELNNAALAEVKTLATELMAKIHDSISNMIWQITNDYMQNYLESDCINNLKDALRNEVARCSHLWIKEPDDFWGKNIRLKIYEEHKEELLPLIRNQQFTLLEEQNARLKEQLAFQCKINESRY